ncbi:MAG: hypothetical protein HY897_03480 [Deltaproteobacteria bacterium]|nr:hypothetical protein [Deltaproteobacteria bacterium]
MTTLREFFAALLARRGALIEQSGGLVETVVPRDVAGPLGLGEHEVLSFDSDERAARRVTLDGELFGRCAGLLAGAGAFATVTASVQTPRIEKLDPGASGALALRNAAARSDRRETRALSHLLSCARYTATSNERHEGMIHVLVNEFTLSTRRLADPSVAIPGSAADGTLDAVERRGAADVGKAVAAAQAVAVRENLSGFVSSQERKLHRDLARVDDYFGMLHDEALRISERRGAAGDADRTAAKITAIDAERARKTHDIIASYRMRVSIEPVVFVRIETFAPVFWVEIRRRKGVRNVPLAYNPLVKALDPPACEGCLAPGGPFWVCDDRLHLVCNGCFAACPACGREYCAACHPGGCPACRRNAARATSSPAA